MAPGRVKSPFLGPPGPGRGSFILTVTMAAGWVSRQAEGGAGKGARGLLGSGSGGGSGGVVAATNRCSEPAKHPILRAWPVWLNQRAVVAN